MNYSKLNLLIRSNKKSVPEIAAICGLTKATLYNILSGQDTKVSTIEKLCSVLSITPAELFLDDNETSVITAHTTGDYSPALSGVNENVTVYATSDKETILSERVAHLTEKNEMLTEMIKEKERLINVLMKTNN